MKFWFPRVIRETYYPILTPLPPELALPVRVHARRVPTAAHLNVCPIWQGAPFASGVREMILSRRCEAWWIRPELTGKVDAILFRFGAPEPGDPPNPVQKGGWQMQVPEGEIMYPEDRSLIVLPYFIFPRRTASEQDLQQTWANVFLAAQARARGIEFASGERSKPART
ncbi:hypothetical protein EEDFHM_02108 [Methylorubrum populi]